MGQKELSPVTRKCVRWAINLFLIICREGLEGKVDISRSMAQEIIDELGGILNQQLNFFDARGYILASAHPERVGSYHAGAARLMPSSRCNT